MDKTSKTVGVWRKKNDRIAIHAANCPIVKRQGNVILDAGNIADAVENQGFKVTRHLCAKGLPNPS